MPSSSTSSSDWTDRYSLVRRVARVRSRSRVLAFTVDAGASLLLAWVALEIAVEALGALGMALPSRYPQDRKPGAAFMFAGQPFAVPEFENRVHLNQLGFHDRDREPTPPPDTRRVAVWGDSIVEGFQVGTDELFTARLEDTLRADGHRVEVLNLGYSGGRMATLLDPAVQRRLRDIGVDTLLVELHGPMEAAHAAAGGGTGILPMWLTGPPGKSRLRELLTERIGLDGLALLFLKGRNILAARNPAEAPDFYYLEHDVDAPGRERAFERLATQLDELRELGDAGIRVAIVYVPGWFELTAERQGAARTHNAKGQPVDYTSLRSRLHDLAAARDLPFLDTTPALLATTAQTHYERDRHWTSHGHAQVAGALEPWLRGELGSAPVRTAARARGE